MKRSSRHDGNGPGGKLGLTLETGAPIWAPEGHGTFQSPGSGGKGTTAVMPKLSTIAAPITHKPLLICDVKAGEVGVQFDDMLARLGRKVAIVDVMGVLASDRPHWPAPNALGSVDDRFVAKSWGNARPSRKGGKRTFKTKGRRTTR